MISRVHSFVLQGIDAIPCEIEADLARAGTLTIRDVTAAATEFPVQLRAEGGGGVSW